MLEHPAKMLHSDLRRNMEKLQEQRKEISKVQTESDVARKYFGNLIRESQNVRGRVERVDLEGPAPGIAAAYDP